MFRFENPIFLWCFCIIPVLIGVKYFLWIQQHKNIKQFGELSLLKPLMMNVSYKRSLIKFILQLVILLLGIIILARPQFGTKRDNETRKGIELVIAMDISNSMLAQDVTPSRLEKSKLLVENLINKFTNDKLGLIVFAGDAFVQLPMTNDYVSAKMFLNDIEPSFIATQGTDIAKAIDLSLKCFSENNEVGKAIVIITDGEDNEGGAVKKAQEAKKRGIKVFILGIGDKEEALIPLANGSYLKDNQGNIVKTRLNIEMCKEIANAGSGTFINVNNTGSAQEKLEEELSKLQRRESVSVVYSEYNEQFQIVAFLLLLILIIETCILESKGELFSRINLFRKK